MRESDSEETPPAPKRPRTDSDRDMANVIDDPNPPSGDVANGPGPDSDVEMSAPWTGRQRLDPEVDGDGADADGGSSRSSGC